MKLFVFIIMSVIPIILHPQAILSVKKISQLTGEKSINKTNEVNVYGTDLGSMFLHNDGKIYFLFGDTFGSPGPPAESGNWRSNTMAFTTDFDPTDGIEFNGWILDDSENAKALVEGNHNANDGSGEVTKIPTAGWSVGNRQYMWFMSISKWGTSGNWDVNYGEIAYSDDNGSNWNLSGIKRLSNSNFIQVSIAEYSGYLYVWGIPAGRFGGVKLARVEPSKILESAAYQYYSSSGWKENEEEGEIIVDSPVGEHSVIWNPFLQRWIMMYLNEKKACIEIRESEEPNGPWSDPKLVACGNKYPALYGAYMHDKYFVNNGETVYFLMSQYGPYNVFLMEMKFKDNTTDIIGKDFNIEQTFSLHQNYPNPFNIITRIKYSIPIDIKHEYQDMRLVVYDILGREAATFVNQKQTPGDYEIEFNAENLNSGIYYYTISSSGFSKTRKMVLLK